MVSELMYPEKWHFSLTSFIALATLCSVWLFLFTDQLANKIGVEIKRLQRRGRIGGSSTHISSSADSGSSSPQQSSSMLSLVSQSSLPTPTVSASSQCHDTPMLSLRQVQLVVGRLLKEHEDRLREEYDKILNEKLTG